MRAGKVAAMLRLAVRRQPETPAAPPRVTLHEGMPSLAAEIVFEESRAGDAVAAGVSWAVFLRDGAHVAAEGVSVHEATASARVYHSARARVDSAVARERVAEWRPFPFAPAARATVDAWSAGERAIIVEARVRSALDAPVAWSALCVVRLACRRRRRGAARVRLFVAPPWCAGAAAAAELWTVYRLALALGPSSAAAALGAAAERAGAIVPSSEAAAVEEAWAARDTTDAPTPVTDAQPPAALAAAAEALAEAVGRAERERLLVGHSALAPAVAAARARLAACARRRRVGAASSIDEAAAAAVAAAALAACPAASHNSGCVTLLMARYGFAPPRDVQVRLKIRAASARGRTNARARSRAGGLH